MNTTIAKTHLSADGPRRNGASSVNGVHQKAKVNGAQSKLLPRRNYISLFSGAMGLDIGLERAGFNCVVCNEINSLAVETIKLNSPALPVIADSVEQVTLKTLSKAAGFNVAGIDLLAGGRPVRHLVFLVNVEDCMMGVAE